MRALVRVGGPHLEIVANSGEVRGGLAVLLYGVLTGGLCQLQCRLRAGLTTCIIVRGTGCGGTDAKKERGEIDKERGSG